MNMGSRWETLLSSPPSTPFLLYKIPCQTSISPSHLQPSFLAIFLSSFPLSCLDKVVVVVVVFSTVIMGTEVVRPQDCLTERIGVPPCRRRNYYYGNGNFPNPEVYSTSNYHSNSNSNPRSNKKPTAVRFESSGQRKKQSEPSISRKSGTVDDLKIPRNNRVVEKVTGLRRGESLESSLKKGNGNGGDFVVTSTARLGPHPKTFSKQIRNLRCPVNGKCDVYAGSAFAVSPAPSSLPLPSFSKKKQVSTDDAATRDLRRLLRLEF